MRLAPYADTRIRRHADPFPLAPIRRSLFPRCLSNLYLQFFVVADSSFGGGDPSGGSLIGPGSTAAPRSEPFLN